MQNKILEKIQTAQHGTERPFKTELLNNGVKVSSNKFATYQLAWANGENWKMINKNYSYEIIETAGSLFLAIPDQN